MVAFKDRLISLDVFRGLTMTAMVLVENPGNWTIYGPLRHARWGMVGEDGLPVHECISPTDLVMPFFIFIIGVSIVFALGKAKEQAPLTKSIYVKILRRTVILFVLGLFFNLWAPLLNKILYGGTLSMRTVSVLQRIAVVYFVAAILFLNCKPKAIVVISVLTLGLYWACTFIPVPGYPEPRFFRHYHTPGNVPACFPEWIDAQILGQPYPEGLLSTLPSIVTALLGVLTGIYLKNTHDKAKAARYLALAGLGLLVAGYGWSLFFPIIKDLWTSSYTLVAGGYSMLGLALVYWWVDVREHRKWTTPWVVYGANCIFVYFASHILSMTLHTLRFDYRGGTVSLHQWINQQWFESWLAPANASLLFALMMVCLWFIPLWVMYKKRIFVKV